MESGLAVRIVRASMCGTGGWWERSSSRCRTRESVGPRLGTPRRSRRDRVSDISARPGRGAARGRREDRAVALRSADGWGSAHRRDARSSCAPARIGSRQLRRRRGDPRCSTVLAGLRDAVRGPRGGRQTGRDRLEGPHGGGRRAQEKDAVEWCREEPGAARGSSSPPSIATEPAADTIWNFFPGRLGGESRVIASGGVGD